MTIYLFQRGRSGQIIGRNEEGKVGLIDRKFRGRLPQIDEARECQIVRELDRVDIIVPNGQVYFTFENSAPVPPMYPSHWPKPAFHWFVQFRRASYYRWFWPAADFKQAQKAWDAFEPTRQLRRQWGDAVGNHVLNPGGQRTPAGKFIWWGHPRGERVEFDWDLLRHVDQHYNVGVAQGLAVAAACPICHGVAEDFRQRYLLGEWTEREWLKKLLGRLRPSIEAAVRELRGYAPDQELYWERGFLVSDESRDVYVDGRGTSVWARPLFASEDSEQPYALEVRCIWGNHDERKEVVMV